MLSVPHPPCSRSSPCSGHRSHVWVHAGLLCKASDGSVWSTSCAPPPDSSPTPSLCGLWSPWKPHLHPCIPRVWFMIQTLLCTLTSPLQVCGPSHSASAPWPPPPQRAVDCSCSQPLCQLLSPCPLQGCSHAAAKLLGRKEHSSPPPRKATWKETKPSRVFLSDLLLHSL